MACWNDGVISDHLLVVNAATASWKTECTETRDNWITSKIEDANVAKGCKRDIKGQSDMLLSTSFNCFACLFCRLWVIFLLLLVIIFALSKCRYHPANAKTLLPTNFKRVAAVPNTRSIGRCQKLLCSVLPHDLNVKLIKTWWWSTEKQKWTHLNETWFECSPKDHRNMMNKLTQQLYFAALNSSTSSHRHIIHHPNFPPSQLEDFHRKSPRDLLSELLLRLPLGSMSSSSSDHMLKSFTSRVSCLTTSRHQLSQLGWCASEKDAKWQKIWEMRVKSC